MVLRFSERPKGWNVATGVLFYTTIGVQRKNMDLSSNDRHMSGVNFLNYWCHFISCLFWRGHMYAYVTAEKVNTHSKLVGGLEHHIFQDGYSRTCMLKPPPTTNNHHQPWIFHWGYRKNSLPPQVLRIRQAIRCHVEPNVAMDKLWFMSSHQWLVNLIETTLNDLWKKPIVDA